ncbi:hypothetical protein KPL35_13350 [Clostridium sp. CF011]|uniref:hypothetical protein n=1 Tax=Clostridium sp. CF011 TaxID=2843318 RepID=UPI001C0B8E02|nr:hypothetical protein [Clostridium sp. CF011]MBU3093056.1 hypothetical protein [Clostridium sp. CF011]WAG69111.1 hypothetical protein LL036_13930 [Clostridium sp. CF011]
MKKIKFSRVTKKMAMKQGAFSILMSFALLIGVIGSFVRGRTGIAGIFLMVTFVSVGFSISFIIKLRKLENLNYLKFEKDRFELNSNFASKGKTIMFNDISKVAITKKYIAIKVGKKPYNILLQHIEPESVKAVEQLFMRYNRK